MKVNFFEKDNANDFFSAMNEMYQCAKVSMRTGGGAIDYVAANETDKRLGYYIPDDGYYLIVRE